MNLAPDVLDLIATLCFAAIIAVLAVSVTLVYGLTGIVNFAQGDLMALGGFVVFIIGPEGGALEMVGLVVAAITLGITAIGLERAMFRFTLRQPSNGFLVSLGLVLIIENALLWHFGDLPANVKPVVQGGPRILGAIVTWQEIGIIVVATSVLVVLQWFLHHTRTGLNLRAAATDKEMAGHLGVNTDRSVILVFGISGILAGVAGALLVGLTPIYPTVGSSYILTAFAVAILGGLGSVRGAYVGALIVSTANTAAVLLGYGSWSDGVSFLIIILVLMFRPKGLFAAASHANAMAA